MRFNEARSFGVEIEFIGTDRQAVCDAIERRGVNASVESYNHRDSRMHWKITTDASCGNEIVSPVLVGQAGFDQLQKVCEALHECGARITTACGLHVHHGARDIPAEAIARFVKLYARYEGVIDMLTSPSRRNDNNSYCHSLTNYFAYEEKYDDLDNRAARGLSVLPSFMGTRYTKVNLEALLQHGTVEVRHHQGTLDFQKIKAWVVFTQALLNHAVDGRVANHCKPTYESLKVTIGAFKSKFGDDRCRAAMKFLDRRFYMFAHPAGINSKSVISPNGASECVPNHAYTRSATRTGEL
jgi:hypothetical protein